MVERISIKKREPEPREQIYDFMRNSDNETIFRKARGTIVVKGKDTPWEQNKQGLIHFLLWEGMWGDVGTPGWRLFIQDIKKQSGRHTHQGGLAIYVLEGKGYSVVDGQRYDWEEDDLILLPIKPDGCEHQHFNLSPSGSAYWMAFIYMPMWEQAGVEFTQGVEHPDWVKVGGGKK
ncbi:MAG: cupin domain-containing protein [Dehalococcoidia bacterium]|nr:cupin domain-containing protein [Dehalococcoidia bacterium]